MYYADRQQAGHRHIQARAVHQEERGRRAGLGTLSSPWPDQLRRPDGPRNDAQARCSCNTRRHSTVSTRGEACPDPPAPRMAGQRGLRSRSAAVHALGDAVADFLVDVAPVFERTLQHGFGHAVLEVSDDVGHQPVALRIVHDLAHQGAGLAEVVVVLAQGVGGADELAAGTPRWPPRDSARRRPCGPPLEFGAYTGSETFSIRIAPSLL